VSGFYYYGESREFIELFSRDYRTFLVEKIKLSVRYLLVLLIPIVFISMIFQPGTWYYIIGAIIIATLIQIITIVFKYALFAENEDLGRNGIIISINVICILIPFLWPLPIIMGIKYYFKAQNNLKKYLDDIN
jgi:putative effector of murein hydrolase